MNAVVDDLTVILPELRRELTLCLGDDLIGLYLYGSYARGEQTPDSDIDVLVVVRDDKDQASLRKRTLDAIAGISLKYDTLVTDVFVSKERFEHEQSAFLMNVRREAVPI